eukprot:INCI2388.1.p1 GENE.INCI2388.1~~INCI2388.1.p1  ORF type:complete len:685 (-),score=152.56 INCI2388.1:36-2090(-)
MAEKMDRAQLVQQLQLRNLSGDGSLDELRARLDEALEEEAMMGGGDDFAAPTKRKSDSVAGGAAAAGEGAEDDSDDEFGPKPVAAPAKKRRVHKLKHEKLYLANLPKALMYEKSYMHRDVLTRVCVTPNTDFVVTASADGHLKFWKKLMAGVQFVKHFKAHLGPIVDLQSSHDGSRVCTLSSDKSLKIYEVLGFDMINMISLGFEPSCCVWLDRPGRPPKIAVGDSGSSVIRVYDAETASDTPPRIVKVHGFAVRHMALNYAADVVVSIDMRGVIEYWDAGDYQFPGKTASDPKGKVLFQYKSETDLYDLAKNKARPHSLAISPDGHSFAVTSSDAQVRVFQFLTGKLRRKYDESLEAYDKLIADGALDIDAIAFGKRKAVDREMREAEPVAMPNAVFDESGNFLVFSTVIGIKVLNLVTNKVARVLGEVESSERFTCLALFQGVPKVDTQLLLAQDQSKMNAKVDQDAPATDPTVFVASYSKHRFYCFSNREPSEEEDEDGFGRDVFNEKPTSDEQVLQVDTAVASKVGRSAVIRTTLGDIHIALEGERCPRTVENFCEHSRNHYYDNVIFHRVIKGFMVQTGDPLGDGTGGESIWGGNFEDEFHRDLRHDRPFTVSMANAGPGTNGSQFFITTVPTPWLDNKHTVFGRVTRGMDIVSLIEKVPVGNLDKPKEDIKILSIDID